MRVAKLIQIVLLSLFTAIGLLATVAIAVDWLQGLDTWFWQESTCSIESSGALERPESGDSEFQVSYRYDFRNEGFIGEAYRHGYNSSEQLSEAQRPGEPLPGRDRRAVLGRSA